VRTILAYTLHIGPEDQVFEIPGWGGVAGVVGDHVFANQISVFCHVDSAKPKWIARFKVTASGTESPGNDYVYCGTAVSAGYVRHVWRNASTEKAQ
jgi:hypothetical protein